MKRIGDKQEKDWVLFVFTSFMLSVTGGADYVDPKLKLKCESPLADSPAFIYCRPPSTHREGSSRRPLSCVHFLCLIFIFFVVVVVLTSRNSQHPSGSFLRASSSNLIWLNCCCILRGNACSWLIWRRSSTFVVISVNLIRTFIRQVKVSAQWKVNIVRLSPSATGNTQTPPWR